MRQLIARALIVSVQVIVLVLAIAVGGGVAHVSDVLADAKQSIAASNQMQNAQTTAFRDLQIRVAKLEAQAHANAGWCACVATTLSPPIEDCRVSSFCDISAIKLCQQQFPGRTCAAR